jgi:tRNA(adenine34) deaminase
MTWNSPAGRDDYFMGLALEAALCAYELGEVPVGAVLVMNDVVVGTGFNQPITRHDPTAHAEVMALRAAGGALQNYRLPQGRLARIVYGASDAKTGVAGSVLNVFEHAQLNHHAQIINGVRADEARQLLQRFFKERRAAHKNATLNEPRLD